MGSLLGGSVVVTIALVELLCPLSVDDREVLAVLAEPTMV